MTEKAEKAEIRFNVTFDSVDDRIGGSIYGHFTARCYVLAVDKYGSKGTPGLISPDSYAAPIDTAPLAGLTITAQMDDSTARGDTARAWYGWRVEYEMNRCLDLRKAEDAVKVLRKIQRKMDAITAQFGAPGDLSAFCGYAVTAVAGHGRVFTRPVTPEQDYEGTGYRSMDVSGLRDYIDMETQKFREKHGIEKG